MKPHLRNPHERAIVTVAGLAGLSLLVVLAAWGLSTAGLVAQALVWIGVVFFALLTLTLIAVWMLGARQAGRARAFLEGERPLVRWTYTAGEWRQLKETLWAEEKGDWKLQWGCLALLLGAAGLLTGVMIGLDEGGLAVVASGAVGLALGGLAGAVIGGFVAGGNYFGARRAYRRAEPGMVALGVDEVYASDDYFRGDGDDSYIRAAVVRPGRPATLELQLIQPPRPRMPREETWVIPLPEPVIGKVEAILPILARAEAPQPDD